MNSISYLRWYNGALNRAKGLPSALTYTHKRKITGLIRTFLCGLIIGSGVGYFYGNHITEEEKKKISMEKLAIVANLDTINAPQFKAPMPKPKGD